VRVFIVEVDGVGDKGTGDTTMVHVCRHTWDLLNMSLRSACFKIEAFFLVKGRTFSLGITFNNA
jgi:hypothetical protein